MKQIVLSVYLIFSFNQQVTAQSRTPNIINGKVIDESVYPEVMRIHIIFPGEQYGCSASAVSHNTLITAAHCVLNESLQAGKVVIATGGSKDAQSIKVLKHPSYSNNNIIFDIAVVVFKDNTFKYWLELSDVYPEVENTFTIVGYGKHEFFGNTIDLKKRYGTNVLTQVGQRLDFYGAATTSQDPNNHGKLVSNASGDSGGPLIINDKLVGVSSSIGAELTPKGQVHCHYENALFSKNMDFLKSAVSQGAVIMGL